MKTAIWSDPIVEETRAWREEILAEAGGDLHQLTARLMESQQRHGDKLVRLDSEKSTSEDSTER